jgi:cupin fold WbuC family metalloprotein
VEADAGIRLRKVNDEVFVAEAQIVRVGAPQIAFLKRQAGSNARGRARICAHRSNDDRLHEMLIAISSASYIHPHKHLGKVESFHVVEGMVDVVMFDDSGAVVDIVELGAVSTGRNFYYRLSDSVFHTLLIHGDFLVVHETTNGPFVREETILAPFAPPEARREEALSYIAGVSHAAAMLRAPTKK